MRILLLALCLLLSAGPSLAADKIRVAVAINCADHEAGGKLASAFAQSFAKTSDYELVDTLPQAKLLLYANRDANSAKNPQGWSIAFARVSNVQSYFAASKLEHTQQTDALAVKPIVTGMVNEEGFLKSLSVAHLDDLSDASIGALADAITQVFVKEMAGVTKR